jgi:hypothetical protein
MTEPEPTSYPSGKPRKSGFASIGLLSGFSPGDLEMFRILKMRTEESDRELRESVAKSVIDLHLDSVQKSLDILWAGVAFAVLFWIVGKLWVLGTLIVLGWAVNFAVKQYIKRRVNSR